MNAKNESDQVGPIIFSNETARSQLVEEGIVTTFRASDRTTGRTWWRKSRTGGKEGTVLVSYRGSANPVTAEFLAEYSPYSGFAGPEDWLEAIHDFHGDPVSGHVYQVATILKCGYCGNEWPIGLTNAHSEPCPQCRSRKRGDA